MALAAIMTQTMLPRVGAGRVPAAELLVAGYRARQHIRRNALQHLHQEITITRPSGTFTLEEPLARLVATGVLTADEARTCTVHADNLEGLLAGLTSRRL